VDEAVRKFKLSNCNDLGYGTWHCPLSDKKFRGKDDYFIMKHIESKFPDKLEEVRVETRFLNNYLMDADRPSRAT